MLGGAINQIKFWELGMGAVTGGTGGIGFEVWGLGTGSLGWEL